METKYDVLCIGLINIDILLKPVCPSIFEADTTKVDEFNIVTGGDAMSEATILSRLGAKVGLMGKVGNDYFGELIKKEAVKNGIDISNIKVDQDTRTSTTLALIGANGERHFVTCKGGNDLLALRDIDFSSIKQSKMISFGSIFGLPMINGASLKMIFKEAKANNIITAADATQDSNELGLEEISDALAYTDIFLPSYDEAVYLTKVKDHKKAADILLKCGVKTVVIKLGGKGCYIKSHNESHEIASYDVKAIDTTGAGDNFVGGFLSGVLNNWDLKKCGQFANAVGAISVREVGAVSAVKDRQQVLNFMNTTRQIG